ncbi:MULTISPECIES: EAL domain-containing response regulator [Vibrio]|uniref:EAL domain-containing response regulator n=1 Tax=Vibrio TaxID=662 RepID=UPI00030BD486|nr:EAL domain-containing response regulator [Vibrio harveyi]EKO3811488.1 EAL domain-containing response regulator [Vibrio harveyi]EKO3855749.1 EAL domain-containing response regulator [Vibrio harveyi]EKO3865109.1 EAL domain-containing response regulator [Vibrio harveyi]EKO3869290.1 EAL domain-containing response regulator [Vibrio harveyi]EMD1174674.1 EAL domain-containing response regulator [Vibrio harveyi]
MNILIVEDDRLQATNLKILLNRLFEGTITIVHRGAEVATICETQPVDLMFCDIDLPDINGVNLLSNLAESARPKGVVILSAMSQDVVEITYNMCLSAGYGFVRALTKPISHQQLNQIFNEFKQYTLEEQVVSLPILIGRDEISTAFEQGWFLNYYQPQYSAKDNRLIGVEALVRCRHPQHGIIAPAQFITEIQARNELDKLFWIVLENALQDMSQLKVNINLSVNMNQKTLKQPMSARLFALCDQYQIAPERITLELTEDEVYDCSVTSLANLANLRLTGVGLAIDDFGTGYSSLSQLATLPYTELKIDRQFIKDALTNFKSQQITISSLHLAKSLGLKSVAEGVEDTETLSYLRELGVELYQGFVRCRPIPFEQLEALI